MHALLTSVGTDGDILPCVGLGQELRQRGHAVTLVAAERYRPIALRHCLEFEPLISSAEHDHLFNHPHFWHPFKTAPLMARWGARLIPRQYRLLSRLVRRDTVLVANPGVLAASLAHEKLGAPLASLVLQPWTLPSSIAPSLMPGLTGLARAPRTVWKLFWRALDLLVDRLVGPSLNRQRAELGLRPAKRIFQNWLSKSLVIAMFPPWYGPPPADWPPQVRLAGFPRFDGDDDPLPPALAEFCASGPAPIAFTFGTGMAHSAPLFRQAAEACARLGRRGIFLTRFRDQLPGTLPNGIFHAAFVPFRKLLPLCAAVLHHGGIGATAAALAAGLPQLIRPICFDQLDNGARVERLGAGQCLRQRKDSAAMAKGLEAVMSESCRANCRALAKRFEGEQPLKAAAEMVESLVEKSRSPEESAGTA